MSTQNENLFIKLVKKSVGLPTGKSDCCGAPAGQSSTCCGSDDGGDCCGAGAGSGCGCGGGDSCCGADKDEEKIESAQEK